MNDMRLRAATPADLTAVDTLLRAAQLPVEGLRDFFPVGYAVVERQGEIVGAIGIERYGSHGLLRSAVVSVAARGTGLGSTMTQDRLAWCKSAGLQDVYLLTTTAPSFFQRLGFTPVDRALVPAEIRAAPEFASICPSSAVVMKLPLR